MYERYQNDLLFDELSSSRSCFGSGEDFNMDFKGGPTRQQSKCIDTRLRHRNIEKGESKLVGFCRLQIA